MSTVSQVPTVEQSLEAFPAASSTGLSVLPESWQRCLLAYLANMYSARSLARTIQSHRKILTAFFVDQAREGRTPGQANTQDFARFERRVHEDGRSLAGSNEIRACLRSFYRFAGSFLPSGEITSGVTSGVIEPPAEREKAPRAKELVAQVSFEQGIITTPISDRSVCAARSNA